VLLGEEDGKITLRVKSIQSGTATSPFVNCTIFSMSDLCPFDSRL